MIVDKMNQDRVRKPNAYECVIRVLHTYLYYDSKYIYDLK